MQSHAIGKPTPRIDGVAKVSGGIPYVYDTESPGMLYGKILRSPIARGKIKKLDTSKAEAMDGVYAVITARNTQVKPFSFSGGIVPDLPDKLILCEETVNYIGDEVAAVAAETPETAEEAMQAIEVEYEELPGVFDPIEALKPDAPKVHEKGNLSFTKKLDIGNVEEAFRQKDLVFVEGEFISQKATHVSFEPKDVIADWNNATGELTLIVSTQAPHTLKQEISRTLDVPLSKIRVIYPPSGGAFGSKLVMNPMDPIAALLSRKAGRPVKIVNTREEEFMTSRTDYPYRIKAKMGLTREGKIVGVDSDVVVDNGAYNDKGPAVLARSTLAVGAHYNIPNIRVVGKLVYTNKQYCTAFRGFGKPQAVFALESLIQMAADKIGMDSVTLRDINAVRKGSKTPTGVPVYTEGLEKCIEEAVNRIGWKNHKKGPNDLNQRYVTGMGFAADAGTAAGNRKYGYNSTDAFIKISEEGKATLISGAVEIGTGATTALLQLVAEVLGLSIADIELAGFDTAVTAYDLGIFGNRTLFVHGNAAVSAAKEAKRQLLDVASKMLGVDASDLDLSDGFVMSKKDPSKKATIKETAAYGISKLGKQISARGQYVDEEAPLAPQGKAPIDPTYSYAAHACQVEVDTETGLVKILRYVAVHDSGTIINPLTARGVVIGHLVQGIGYTLMEDLIMEDGRVINPNFLDYKIPAMEESPSGIEVVFVNEPDPLGPFGAKGLGENSASPVVAAIANALDDALGIRFYELPITPVRVLAAIKKRKSEGLSTKTVTAQTQVR